MHTARAQQLVEAAEGDFGDGNVDDLRHLLAALQELLEHRLILNRLLAALASEQKPESVLHRCLSLFRGKLLECPIFCAVG